MHLRSLLREPHRHPVRLIRLLASLFALGVILGAVLFYGQVHAVPEDDLFRPSDLHQWKPLCFERGNSVRTCHLVYPFTYADPALGDQLGILSINGHDADLTLAVQDFAPVRWQIDDDPTATAESTREGRFVTGAQAKALLVRMFSGRRLELSFATSTGTRYAQHITLDGFTSAYLRMRQMLRPAPSLRAQHLQRGLVAAAR
jgi:hypothetical protein